jgi:hypothetical protein
MGEKLPIPRGKRIPEKAIVGDPIDVSKFSYFKNGEFYGCLNLTEAEHYIIEEELKRLCNDNCLTLHYYRKLKEGHVPCYREFKVSGHKLNMSKLDEYIEESGIFNHLERNPHTVWRKDEK